MNTEQEKRTIDALVVFVEKVANGKATSETEVQVLPEIAKLLLSINHH